MEYCSGLYGWMTESDVTNLISRSLKGVEQDCSSIQLFLLMTTLDVHVTTTIKKGVRIAVN